MRTLIIDDDDDMRFLLRSVIEAANEGLEVAGEADGGVAGLDRWRAAQPDVVVVDQRMPGMTGLEVAARILGEDPRQPIILFSAYLDDALVAEAEALGVRACVAKDAYHQIPAALWRHSSER